MSRNGRWSLLAYVALLSLIGLLASDMYLPSLDRLQDYFGVRASLVGLSLSVYMVGFTIAQLFYGAISDNVGRKIPLLTGLTLFLIGTVGCMVSSDIFQFLAFRLVQSIGVCAAYILWQPIVIDLFEKHEVQGLFSTIMALGGLSPALAPVAGGALAEAAGWKSVFLVLALLGSLLLVSTLALYRESLRSEARSPFSASAVLRSYTHFLNSRFFIGYAGAISCGITMYLVFLTIIPFVMADLGYAVGQIGLMYLPIALTFLLGTVVSKRLYGRLGDVGTIRWGVSLGVAGALCLLGVTLLVRTEAAWQIVTPFCCVTFGNGFLVPTGSAYLMRSFERYAGACASAMGFLTTAIAFVSTAVASLLYDQLRALGMSATIFSFGCAMFLFFVFAQGGTSKPVEQQTVKA